jgi:pimeloyl-ACP methyl ester carboxylesterase
MCPIFNWGLSFMPSASTAAVSRPSLFLALTELPRAIMEFSSLPLAMPMLTSAPHGDGHPVMVLPGFVTTDRSTVVLRNFLTWLGYDAQPWELGRNLGPKAIGVQGERLVARLDEIYEETGEKVSLVGWSLGGVMARQLARRRPEKVRQIVTLGSPFVGNPKATNARAAYEALTGQKLSDPELILQLEESQLPPPVPSTAIYTKEDGIVAWQNCVEPADGQTDNIQVFGSHCGLGVNPIVLYALADRLAQADGAWKPFNRNGLKAFMYPSSGHVH